MTFQHFIKGDQQVTIIIPQLVKILYTLLETEAGVGRGEGEGMGKGGIVIACFSKHKKVYRQ